MPRKVAELSAKQVRDLNKKGSHSVGGVPGLKLQISSDYAKSWILRVTVGNKRCEIGLGGFPEVSLSTARDKARDLKDQVRLGRDPIAEKKQHKLELIKQQNLSTTFENVAIDAHKVKLQEFKNVKHSNQWINTLRSYAFPVLGGLPINDIGVNDVMKVLEPIWAVKTETATRVRQRIAAVFDHALARGIRTNPNPANWNGCLKDLLPNL